MAAAQEERLSSGEVRRRALAGVAVLGARGVALRAMNFAGYIVLARLLSPRELGTVALGLTIVFSAHFFVDAGIGATLIRRPSPPDRKDLQAVVFFQLAVAVLIAGATAAAAAPFGDAGWVTALMVAAFPLTAFRTPGVVLLERNLNYRPLALVELTEVLVFQVCAIALVVSGLGVWGVAWATVAKTLAGSAMMVWRGPSGFVLPAAHWRRMRSMLGFAGKFQAVALANLVRDQGLNVGIVLIAGTGVLGLWSLASRLLLVPMLFFQSMWQVSFPAMSRVLARGEDAAPLVARTASLAAVGTGGLLVPLVAAAPALVPALFGARWAPVADVLAWSCLALAIAGPVSVASSGYLLAAGAAGSVLRATIAHTVVWAVVAFSLLPVVGIVAVGIGHAASAIVELVLLSTAVSRRCGARTAQPVAVPLAVGAVAAGVGWAVSSAQDANLGVAVLGGALGAGIYVGLLLVVRRAPLLETVRMVARAVRVARVTPA